MRKRKRTINVRVRDTAQTIKVMEGLGKLDMDLVAESHPGLVKVVVQASKEEMRELERKVRELAGGRNPHKLAEAKTSWCDHGA